MHLVGVLYIALSFLMKDALPDSYYHQYLQPDDVNSGDYDESWNIPDHICARDCVKGENLICYYRFVVESYVTMSESCGNCARNTSECFAEFCVTADGFQRSILSINRRMPGPTIQVCEGDTIVVDVKNMMPGRSTTIHWHGIRQADAKFMDGVPMVTQCPILESDIFRYTFPANDPGLHFYHSHDGLQKVDGMVSGMVIRKPRSEDPNSSQYDYDLPSHLIIVQDWVHVLADEIFPGIRGRPQTPETYLINGRGHYYYSNGTRIAETPLAIFKVGKGHRYVFRIVAGTCFECQYTMTIEGHDFAILGADGRPTKPYRVNSLTMSPGERFTIVMHCDKDFDSYWIQVRAVGFCESTRAYQVAILQYEGHSGIPSTPEPGYDVSPVNDPGLTMNPFNSNCTDEEQESRGPCVEDLRSSYDTPNHILEDQPCKRIIFAFGFYLYPGNRPSTNDSRYAKYLGIGGVSVASMMNGVVFDYPPCPLLSQWAEVPQSSLCPDDGFPLPTWNEEHRQCVNVIKVPAHCTVEIVVIDARPIGLSHSIHLHGYDMYILEQGPLPAGNTLEESVSKLLNYMDSDGRKKLPKNVITKDTMALSSGGYFFAKIFTDNIGFWFIHCHFAYHLDSGMNGVLQVGEYRYMPSPPPYFPRCGDYLPVPEDCD